MPVLVPLVTWPPADFVDGLQRAWANGDAVLPVDHRHPQPQTLLDALGAGQPVEPGDALVMATSGTTGHPKGVVLTHEAIEASARATSDQLEVDPSADCWLSLLPLAHIGGLSVIMRALLTGTPYTFDPDDPAATLVSVVPTQIRRMDISRFRVVLAGGAAPDWEQYGSKPPNVVTTYGMTETGSGVVYDGIPLAGVDVRLDSTRQIHVRGPMLLRCYRDGTDPKENGWLATGDAGGYRPRDRRLFVYGRMHDVIVTGGEKVWPIAVESILRTLPGIEDVAVAGRPDPEWGHRVVAFVVGDTTLDEVRSAVKQTLPAYCAPKELVLVDELPKTALGKVRRGDL